MRNVLTSRGVRSSLVAGVIIGVLAAVTDEYRPLWLALGIAWAAAATTAIVTALRREPN
jgi:hypothetical protein